MRLAEYLSYTHFSLCIDRLIKADYKKLQDEHVNPGRIISRVFLESTCTSLHWVVFSVLRGWKIFPCSTHGKTIPSSCSLYSDWLRRGIQLLPFHYLSGITVRLQDFSQGPSLQLCTEACSCPSPWLVEASDTFWEAHRFQSFFAWTHLKSALFGQI